VTGNPLKSFLPLVQSTNRLLEKAVDILSYAYPGRVQLADCGHVLADREFSTRLNTSLFQFSGSDKLHPNANGLRLLFHCLSPSLRELSNSSRAEGNRAEGR
jgi:hypothetical protein